jgi:glycosyltransferase involved in cell wall biosynthesis
MRALILSSLYPPVLGGAELQAQKLARALVSLGVRITVLTQPCAGAPMHERDGDIRIIRALSSIALGPLWGLTYMMSTHRWLRRLASDWDVLHNQQVALHCWPSVRVAAVLGKPCLLRFACPGPGGDLALLRGHQFGRYFVERLRSAQRLVALTELGADEIRRYGLPGERIRTIPNGVELDRFSEQPWPQLGASEALRLLFVGRLSAQKGLDVLLSALATLRRPEIVRLRVVGAGPELEQLRRQADEAGLNAIVEFCGRQQDVVTHYAWSELVVLPSRFEGMPNVVLEAMSCARPVLGTRIAGTTELIAEARSGWLVPSDDPAALARRLERAAKERAALRSMGLAGRAIAKSEYSMTSMAARYLREYEAMRSEGITSTR